MMTLQALSVYGDEVICHSPDHIDCHEPAIVLVHVIPDAVHMPDEVDHFALCQAHFDEYEARKGK